MGWLDGSLYVADGALGELMVYNGTPLALAGTLKLSDDADDMVYDEASHLLFVGHGGAANPAKIAVVDTIRFSIVASLSVATHPEALEIDAPRAARLCQHSESNEVAVIDLASRAITAQWKLSRAGDNVPLAYDVERHLLYVGLPPPGTLIRARCCDRQGSLPSHRPRKESTICFTTQHLAVYT